MTYTPKYESAAVSDAIAAAEARLVAAKNRRREAKGLPPIGAAARSAPLSDGTPLQALPEWRLNATQARLYGILVACCPLSLAEIGRALHGSQGDHTTGTAALTNLRAALRGRGVVIPLIKDHKVARPYMKPPTEGQAASPPSPVQVGKVSAQ